MPESPDRQTPERRFGAVMIGLMWAALLAVLVLLMQQWLDKRHNPNDRLVLRTTPDGARELVLERNAYGHYVAGGRINGEAALFMLDTGATDVVVPEEIAGRYGLEYGPAAQSRTANGTIRVYMTRVDRVTLGPFELRNVSASINPHMEGDEILLGMSFLKHLNLTQHRNTLTISQPQEGPK